jgi:hypothetical protein
VATEEDGPGYLHPASERSCSGVLAATVSSRHREAGQQRRSRVRLVLRGPEQPPLRSPPGGRVRALLAAPLKPTFLLDVGHDLADVALTAVRLLELPPEVLDSGLSRFQFLLSRFGFATPLD